MSFFSSLGRDLRGGSSAYKNFNNQRNKWVEAQIGKAPELLMIDGDLVRGDPKAAYEYEQKAKALRGKWFDTLDPATRKAAEDAFGQHSSDMGTINKVGKGAALGIIGAAAGGAALTGAGVIGSGAASAGGAGQLGGSGSLLGGGVGGTGSGLGVAGLNAGSGTALGGAGAGSAASGVIGSGIGTTLGTGSVLGAGGLAGSGAGGGILSTIGRTVAGAGSSLLTGGSGGGGGGGSAFRNTLTGEVSGDQEDLNDLIYGATQDQLTFNRDMFDYYRTMTDNQYRLGQEVFDWNRGLAEDARDRANRYDDLYFNTTGRQLQAFSDAVDAYDAPAEGIRRSGRAVADVEAQLSNARGAQVRGLTARGWNPNSAAMQSSMADMELEGALAKASASTMAYEAAKREGLNLRAQAAGLGQQNSTVATTNTGLAGDLATSGMNASNTGLQPSFTNLGLYNTGQNTAINWGNAANSGFNSMRTGNSSWSDNLNYGGALLGGLRGYAGGGLLGGVFGAAGGLLGG